MNPHTQNQRDTTRTALLKCKYCERWFKNASGRTKHVGIHHPRGHRISDLHRAYGSNSSSCQAQHPSGENPGDDFGTETMGIDAVECTGYDARTEIEFHYELSGEKHIHDQQR